jgi:preprotein translocase subunit SecE
VAVSKTVGYLGRGFFLAKPIFYVIKTIDMIAKIKKYSNEIVGEMKKVSWPTKQQLRESTIVVIVMTGIITLFTFVIDEIMTVVIKTIF